MTDVYVSVVWPDSFFCSSTVPKQRGTGPKNYLLSWMEIGGTFLAFYYYNIIKGIRFSLLSLLLHAC